jgi:hypothetical protein
MPEIETLPPAVSNLSRSERAALMEVEPLAEDLALRGDGRAALVLEWCRTLLSIKEPT